MSFNLCNNYTKKRRNPNKARDAYDWRKNPKVKKLYADWNDGKPRGPQLVHAPIEEPNAEIKYINYDAQAKTLKAIWPRQDLSIHAKAVAVALAIHAPNVQPSIPRLMVLCSIRSNNTVYKALRELKDAGLLEWENQRWHYSNQYQLRWL